MDGGGLHRSLLAAASHAQQQHHVQLHAGDGRHVAGNVFLPAIQKRSSAQSALSMKHLQVIEQCILAENRREEQLAKCPSEKERRYLTKKFIAQRNHERDLLQALMLGQPTDQELQIVDVSAANASPLAAKSPSGRRAEESGGVHVLATSPDKVIRMFGEKTFATNSPANKQPTKAVSPHFHGDKSPVRRSVGDAVHPPQLPTCSASPAKKTVSVGSSPTRQRATRSATPTCKSPAPSPPRKPAEDARLPRALQHSPLKQSIRKPLHSPQATTKALVPSPAKRKKPKPVDASVQPGRQSTAGSVDSSNGNASQAISFEGATSFLEARQLAMAMVHEQNGLVEGETQTTERGDGAGTGSGGGKEKFVLMLTGAGCGSVLGETSPSKAVRRCRPQSSPEPRQRRPCAEAHALPSLVQSYSDKGFRRFELFRSSDVTASTGVDEGATFVSENDAARTVHVVSETKLVGVLAQQLAWEEPPRACELVADRDRSTDAGGSGEADQWEAAEQPISNDVPAFGVSGDAEDDDDGGDDSVVQESVVAAASQREDDPEDGLDPSEPADGDVAIDDDHSILLSVIYDLVHRIEDTEDETLLAVHPIDTDKVLTPIGPAPKTRRASLIHCGRFATQIQSAFRGHRARRAFRLALYRQALDCGVLGAMPGTQQGRSGWYQDPKSFLAYYFVVRADGEWTQKIVLRCSALVLTPYHMHEQILARVHVPAADDEV